MKSSDHKHATQDTFIKKTQHNQEDQKNNALELKEEKLDLVPAEAREIFSWETSSKLGAMGQEFVLWDQIAIEHGRVEALCHQLNRLHRDFVFYSMQDLVTLSAAMETSLQRFLHGEFFQTDSPERVFFRCLDALRLSMNHFADTGKVSVDDLGELLQALHGLLQQQIGSLLLEAGLVSNTILKAALKAQQSRKTQQPTPEEKPLRLGEVLVLAGKVTQEQVDSALREQDSRRQQVKDSVEWFEAIYNTLPSSATTHG